MRAARQLVENIERLELAEPVLLELRRLERREVKVALGVLRALRAAGVLWHCLWARPALVRQQGHGLRALEEHEWRRHHASNWNDI